MDKNSPKPVLRPKLETESLFDSIHSEHGAFWLDSSMRFSDRGHYSFIGFNPSDEIIQKGDKLICNNFNSKLELPKNKLFPLIEKLTQKDDKFAVGYFSYESALPYLGLDSKHSSRLPDNYFLFYDDIFVFDHDNQKWLDKNYQPLSSFEIPDVAEDFEKRHFISSDATIKAIEKNRYVEQVQKIKDHIKEGDIYQANFTSCIEIATDLDPYSVYKQLRKINASPYSCYINFSDFKILSSSPERMFYKDGNHITSSPIKGTIQRGESRSEEAINLDKLTNSEKDRAELLMIVDLIRNDLGKIAETGTVKVDSLFKPEIYPGLIHLVADISARLKAGVSLEDITRALLPGGSITGAPKKRAVEIINECEDQAREIYTGCIGYLHREKADFNIAIRTMYHENGTFYLHGGGGIVADSNIENEYNEMMLKVNNLLKALGI